MNQGEEGARCRICRSEMGTSLIQIGSVLSGASLPVAYGPVRARGNNVINQQLSDNSRVLLYVLGEGVWDGPDHIWISGKLVDLTTTTIVHFHNGFDGTLGAGLAPSSNGGDQLVDNFWSLLPANYQRLTFSRKAYLMVHAVPDAQAPSNIVDVVGDYRTSRVRIFDNVGNQTAFQYSLNPAWQILDVVIRLMLNREWTAAGAAVAGGDLTAAQKARINFQSFSDSAAWCDFNIGGGVKRFEGGVAYPNLTGLQSALDQLCTLSQTYMIEASGQICLFPDQARVSTFILTSDHITPGTFFASKTQLRAAQNRFVGTFNDLNAQKVADIDTVGNIGLSRTGGILTVKVPVGQTHPFFVNDNVDIVSPTNATFAGTIVVASVIDPRTFTGAQAGANATSGGGYVGTTESRFAQRTTIVDHEQHQLAVGQRGLNLGPTYKRVPITIDFGNNTLDRVQRLLAFIKTRNLGADILPYAAPFTVEVQASLYSVDVNTRALIAQLDGDLLTIDKSISEEYQGDYEIMSTKRTLPATGSGSSMQSSGENSQAETIDLKLKQYVPAFTDFFDIPQSLAATLARLGLVPVEHIDAFGNLIVSLAKTSDDVASGRFARRVSRITNGGAAQWFNLGTWVFAGDGAGHTLHIDLIGGVGFNTGAAQQGHAEIVVRSSNNGSGAPNISGGTWTAMGTSSIAAVKIVASGGSILQTNASWEIWAQVQAFGDMLLQASVDTTDTWTASGAAGADPGAASATVAVATGRAVVDATGIANPTAIDLSRGYTGKHLGNMPDDSASGRFARTGVHSTYRPLSNPLTATDAGSNDTIPIAAFTMRVGALDVPISSGSITTLSRSTLYFIYYDDATLAGGSVSFNASTTKETALSGAGRFFVGSIVTPAAGSIDTIGNNDGGAGAQSGTIFRLSASLFSPDNGVTWQSIANTNGIAKAASDGDTTTSGTMQSDASAGGVSYLLSGFPALGNRWSSLILKARSSATDAASGTPTPHASIAYSVDGFNTFAANLWAISGLGATHALATDSLSLPLTTAMGNFGVRLNVIGPVAGTHLELYELWVEAQV
jgi:hypothetical protein